jgi:Transposase.
MAGIFWYSEGILLVEFLKRGATFNSERYVQILKKLIQ